jgi:hypothetical protein
MIYPLGRYYGVEKVSTKILTFVNYMVKILVKIVISRKRNNRSNNFYELKVTDFKKIENFYFWEKKVSFSKEMINLKLFFKLIK